MEIVSIQKLWKSYDPNILPLYTTVISDKTVNGIREMKAFYHGRSTNDGEIRVFVRVLSKEGDEKKPGIIFLKDTDEDQDEEIMSLAELGYAVVVPDYLGSGSASPLHTFYPESLSSCCITAETEYEPMREDITKSQWVIWTEIAMRGITFAQSIPYIDKNAISVIGVGTGSGIAIKLAAIDTRIKCTVSIYSSGFSVSGLDDLSLQYKASIVDAAYAGLLKAPLLMLLSSNGSSDALTPMLEVYLRFPQNLVRLSISERPGREIGNRQKNSIDLFIKDCLSGRIDEIPQCPVLSSEISAGTLKYTVSGTGNANVTLFTAVDKKNAGMRNWHRTTNMTETESGKVFAVDVFNTEITLIAFANAFYEKGYLFSSLALFKSLKGSGVIGSHLSLRRLVYDNDMGTDDWISLVPHAAYDNIRMETGPHGITGVTAKNGRLTMLKLGDDEYTGEDGLSLQITMYSPSEQTAKVTFMMYDESVEGDDAFSSFSIPIKLAPHMEWQKVLLSEVSFKTASSKGLRWKNVESLSIESEESVLVSSVLWM